LASLHFAEARLDGLARLSDAEWRSVLHYCDRARLTLALRETTHSVMPPWVLERTGCDAARNIERLHVIEDLYRTLAAGLSDRGAEFLALKGITHCPLFGCAPGSRAQYDIDLFLPRQHLDAAMAALTASGYEPMPGMENFPTDHLPAMIRKTGWEWRGDFYDPDMPLAVECHFQFWNDDLERLPAPGVEEFWRRRVTRTIAGFPLSVLCPPDLMAYAILHLIRHLLRGNVKVFHVYEIARFLHLHASDEMFWSEWRQLHPPQLRLLQAVGFRLAQAWFGNALNPVALDEIERLPAGTKIWFEQFSLSPAASEFLPNKDELWLHLSLLHSPRDAWSVAVRRLLPGRLPGAVDAVFLPESQITWRRRVLMALRYLAYAAKRTWHHATSLPPTAISGARWWWRVNSLGRTFWTFLWAAVLFNFSLYIFALLYNLYLLDLGFREDFLGLVNSASRVGSLAGTLPGAALAYRFGLRKTLLGAIAGTAIVEVLRAISGARMPLTGLAFVSGFIFSAWAVVMTPIIAAAVSEKHRPAAYGVFFATMFSLGIGANWLGGRLPLWMHSKQSVLLLSGAMAASGLLPALRLRFAPMARGGGHIYPRSRFLVRFLFPFAVWHLATGAFNPFGNVYFARMGVSVARIGSIFSVAQLVQAVTVLLAPLLFRRTGLVSGIVCMMAATAIGMGGLAAQPPGAAAALAYTAYMSFQWMSEPGLNTLLMNHVDERERSGASGLNYLVAFSAQALAAFGSGELLTRFGYGPVLAGAGVVAGLAASLFYLFLRPKSLAVSSRAPAADSVLT